MRRLSIRGVLFVLALVFQALATGGLGLDEKWPAAQSTGAAYCQRGAGASDRRLPTGQGRHGTDCLSCQICLGGYSPPLTLAAGGHLEGLRNSNRASFAPYRRVAARLSVAQSHRARAPPSLS